MLGWLPIELWCGDWRVLGVGGHGGAAVMRKMLDGTARHGVTGVCRVELRCQHVSLLFSVCQEGRSGQWHLGTTLCTTSREPRTAASGVSHDRDSDENTINHSCRAGKDLSNGYGVWGSPS